MPSFPELSCIRKLQILRYPGSKAWLLPSIAAFVAQKRPRFYLEPFCGGGVVGLSLLHADLIDELILCEIDVRLVAFWRRALDDPSFATEVGRFQCTRRNVERVIANPQRDLALWTLVQNRCSYGGRLNSGLLRHGDGNGVASRWDRRKLFTMLRQVRALSGRIHFIARDGIAAGLLDFNDAGNFSFVDPPYSLESNEPAKLLYEHWKLDHELLFRTLSRWRGTWIATYPDTAEVRRWVDRHNFVCLRKTMRTTAHKRKTELLIMRPPENFAA